MDETPLDPERTFASFVVGPSNREAYGEVLAVATRNGGADPLWVHGGPGVGKSHLLAALAALRKRDAAHRIAHVQAGKIRALGVTSAKRSSALPAVPTIAEQGFPGYEVSSGFGMIGPAGLPRPIVERLNSELIRALKLPDVRERFASQGAEPVGDTPDQHEAFIRAEVAKWIKVVKDAGIPTN